MKVRFHGRLADAIGPELEIEAPRGCSIAELRDRLAAAYPETELALRSKHALALVGGTMVRDDHRLDAADHVEFLPPVSGG